MIETIQKYGDYAVVKANNDVLNGIQDVTKFLNAGVLYFHEDCKNTFDEFETYSWDEDSTEDAVIKENDHCITGETLIDTERGQVPIKELVGMSGKVWSYNTKRKAAELKTFHSVRKTRETARIIKITLKDGRSIRCTEDHPILTTNGYVLAKYLTPSKKIVDISDYIRYNNH